jgi:uncharacterized repeat protein (TIGR03803 family)
MRRLRKSLNSVLAAFLAGVVAACEPVTSSQVLDARLRSATSSYGYQILYKFPAGGADGATPLAGVIDVNGVLYGTTSTGGNTACASGGCGTVFSLDSTGKETLLHEFRGGSDGEFPAANLVYANGTLYGTTGGSYVGGGTNNCGTIFAIKPNGSHYRVMYAFAGGSDGEYPLGNVIKARGKLFGTTYEGGQYGDGTVFEFELRKHKERILHSFAAGTDGAKPMSGLIDVAGILYGTTSQGGVANSWHNAGTVFEVGKQGKVELIFVFDLTDGEAPYAPLLAVGSTLYGTTSLGGAYNWGTVFSMNVNGTNEQVLHNFNQYTDGWFPETGLVAMSGLLYGTTNRGGFYDDGTVYSIDPNTENEQLLHSFGDYRDGGYPNGVVSSEGILYGTSQTGSGSGAVGSVWRLSPY